MGRLRSLKYLVHIRRVILEVRIRNARKDQSRCLALWMRIQDRILGDEAFQLPPNLVIWWDLAYIFVDSMVVGRRGYVRVRPIMWLAVIAYMIGFTHQLRFIRLHRAIDDLSNDWRIKIASILSTSYLQYRDRNRLLVDSSYVST